MIHPSLLAVLALIHDRARLLEELSYIVSSGGGCDGTDCNHVRPCAVCVARYAEAGWQLHHGTRRPRTHYREGLHRG